jgi:hypothetical protein
MLPSNLYRARGRSPPKAWISLDSLGRIRTFQWVTRKTREKILCPLNSLVRLRANAAPDKYPPSDPSIANRQSSSSEMHNLVFCICQRIGLWHGGRRSDQNEPQGLARPISSRPESDEVRGSSSVVVRLATSSPLSPLREEPGRPGSDTARSPFGRNLRRLSYRARHLWEASSSSSTRR